MNSLIRSKVTDSAEECVDGKSVSLRFLVHIFALSMDLCLR